MRSHGTGSNPSRSAAKIWIPKRNTQWLVDLECHLVKVSTLQLPSQLELMNVVIDGFDTLKSESVGGDAEEVSPDEYGLLISMILRQYFLSLRVLTGMSGNMAWGQGMASTWGNIGAEMNKIHPIRESDRPEWHDPAEKGNVDDYGEDDYDAPAPGTQDSVEHGRKLAIMRKTLRKWRKHAGLKMDGNLPSHEEEKFGADWTNGICPLLDGRIKMTEEPMKENPRAETG